jgi:hypothetical protein
MRSAITIRIKIMITLKKQVEAWLIANPSDAKRVADKFDLQREVVKKLPNGIEVVNYVKDSQIILSDLHE